MPTCEQCGEEHLRWQETDDERWVLVDDEGVVHPCMTRPLAEEDFGTSTPEPTDDEWSAGEHT